MSFSANHTICNSFGTESDQSSISNLIKVCDCINNLQISIYLPKNEKFIYSNPELWKIIGNYSAKILNQGWDFWFDIVSEEDLCSVKYKIKEYLLVPDFKAPYVLKYHIIDKNGDRIFLRHELFFHYLKGHILVINYFFNITEKEKIEAYFKVANNIGKDFYKKKNLISSREKEVLKLVAEGFSSKQIAERLFISNHTVISHRKNLKEKFKVKNTAQLINRASRSIEF